jgi:membrane protein required for beta-lactamase induction
MAWIIVVLCLVAERLLLAQEHYRSFAWLHRYTDWLQARPLPVFPPTGASGLALVLIPPLLGLALTLYSVNDWLLSIPQLAIAALVLLYSLGPRDLYQQVTELIAAEARGDWEQAEEMALRLQGRDQDELANRINERLEELVFQQANSRIFAVLFWFVVLGPVAALGYRLSSELTKTRTPGLAASAQRLVGLLDWIPARGTALAYALAGSFEDAMQGWRNWPHRRDEFADSASAITASSGVGALGIEPPIPSGDVTEHADLLESALSLVARALVVWLGFLAVPTLAGWV